VVNYRGSLKGDETEEKGTETKEVKERKKSEHNVLRRSCAEVESTLVSRVQRKKGF